MNIHHKSDKNSRSTYAQIYRTRLIIKAITNSLKQIYNSYIISNGITSKTNFSSKQVF